MPTKENATPEQTPASNGVSLEHGNRGQTYHLLVKQLLAEGKKPTEAFAIVGEQVNVAAATIATSYYRAERAQNPDAPKSRGGRPRGNRTTSHAAAPARPTGAYRLLKPEEVEGLMDELAQAQQDVFRSTKRVEELWAKLMDFHARQAQEHEEREQKVQEQEAGVAELRAALAKFA